MTIAASSSKANILAAVVKASIVFAAVNLDEFAVLIIFFSKVDHKEFKNIHVILGQLIGFTIVFGISCIGLLFRNQSFINLKYVALLGLVPLVMGLFDLVKVIRYWYAECNIDRKSNSKVTRSTLDEPLIHDDDVAILHDDEHFVLNGHTTNHHTLSTTSDTSNDSDDDSWIKHTCSGILGHILHPSTLIVCLTIIADGGEEIGVFLPLLASSDRLTAWVVIITLYILIALQCFLAYSLVRCKYIGSYISRYSKNVLPFVLIGLGVYILKDSILMDYI